jgi:hypothetical protein
MIKIVSGYSEKGGSTVAFINLTNAFNSAGIDCTFYGPHTWHLDKCKSGILNDGFIVNPDDILICHFLKLPSRPAAKKVILHCHEKWWFKVGEVKQYWDLAVFSHQQHRDYHSDYKGDFVILPNLREPLEIKDKSHLDLVAGIIGPMEDRKQPHVSIQRALEDGCEKVYLFGHIADQTYFETYVKPLLNSTVEFIGHIDDKQKMYDMVGRVYHSSKSEVACLVKDNCYSTNTKFFGNEETEHEISTLTNDEILDLYKKILGIN